MGAGAFTGAAQSGHRTRVGWPGTRADMATGRQATSSRGRGINTPDFLFLLLASLPLVGKMSSAHVWDMDLRANRQMTGTHCNESNPKAKILISRTVQEATSDLTTLLLECCLLSGRGSNLNSSLCALRGGLLQMRFCAWCGNASLHSWEPRPWWACCRVLHEASVNSSH